MLFVNVKVPRFLKISFLLKLNMNFNFYKAFANGIKKKYVLPNMDDYFGTLMGIFRLQDTYEIEPKMFLNKTLSRLYPAHKKLNCK